MLYLTREKPSLHCETRFLTIMETFLKTVPKTRLMPVFNNAIGFLLFLICIHISMSSIGSASEGFLPPVTQDSFTPVTQDREPTFPEHFEATNFNQLALAGSALEYGKTKRAAKLATGLTPATPEATLVLARLAAKEKQYDEAIKHYRSLKTPTFELETIRISELVRLLEKAGRHEEVISTIQSWKKENGHHKTPSSLKGSLHTAKAKAWRALDDKKKALDAYQKALRTVSNTKLNQQLKVEYGTLLLETRMRYRGKSILTPLAFEAKEAFIMTDALTALTKAGFAPKWSDAERFTRAETLTDMREFELALETLEPVLKSKNLGMAKEAKYLTARLLIRTRQNYDRALALLDEITPNRGAYKLKTDLVRANCFSRMYRTEEAIAVYKQIAEGATSQKVLAAKTYYAAARLEYYANLYEDAAETSQLLLKKYKNLITPSQKQELLFIIGISMLALGKDHLATDYFFQAGRGIGKNNTLDQAKHVYWRAVSLLKSKPDEAKDLFHHICAIDPTLWYSQLAITRLKDGGMEPGPCVLEPVPRGKPPHDLQKSLEELSPTAAFLKRAGFNREAGVYLALAERQGKARTTVVDFLQHYEKLESPQYTIGRAASNWTWPPSEEFRYRASRAYPTPYAELTQQVEKKHNLPGSLIHSIARKESLFNPNTVSYAGAMGLMQFMPKTYEANRIKAGLPPLEDGLLPGPIESIICAGYEFETLLTRFNNQLPLAIMAYNGGPEAVASWVERSADEETDIFVEKIAFTQTRNYVRRVYQNLARYRLLNDEPLLEIPRRIVKTQGQ